jgi:hypothetical protein
MGSVMERYQGRDHCLDVSPVLPGCYGNNIDNVNLAGFDKP